MSGCAQLKGFWVAADRASQLVQLPCQLFVYLPPPLAFGRPALGWKEVTSLHLEGYI